MDFKITFQSFLDDFSFFIWKLFFSFWTFWPFKFMTRSDSNILCCSILGRIILAMIILFTHLHDSFYSLNILEFVVEHNLQNGVDIIALGLLSGERVINGIGLSPIHRLCNKYSLWQTFRPSPSLSNLLTAWGCISVEMKILYYIFYTDISIFLYLTIMY